MFFLFLQQVVMEEGSGEEEAKIDIGEDGGGVSASIPGEKTTGVDVADLVVCPT